MTHQGAQGARSDIIMTGVFVQHHYQIPFQCLTSWQLPLLHKFRGIKDGKFQVDIDSLTNKAVMQLANSRQWSGWPDLNYNSRK